MHRNKQKINPLFGAIIAGLVVLALFASPIHAQQSRIEGVRNGEFEQGTVGQPPPDWTLEPSQAGSDTYAAQITSANAFRGWYSGCIYTTRPPEKGEFVLLTQTLSADGFRGRALYLEAHLRIELERGTKGGATLWARIDRTGNPPLYITEMQHMNGKLAFKKEWKTYFLTTMIPSDAEAIQFGVLMAGSGRVYLDSINAIPAKVVVSGKSRKIFPLRSLIQVATVPVKIKIPPKTTPDTGSQTNPNTNDTPPRTQTTPDTPKTTETDSTTPANPSLTALRTVKVRALPNANFEQGKVGQIPPNWFVPPAIRRVGFGAKTVEGGPGNGNKCAVLFRDPKAKTPNTSKLFANMMQTLDAAPFRGKRIAYRAWIRVAGKTPKDHAQMWLRVDRNDGTVAFLDMMDKTPLRDGKWRQYTILGDVADDARTVTIGVIFLRDGKAFVDNVTVGIVGNLPDADKRANSDDKSVGGE